MGNTKKNMLFLLVLVIRRTKRNKYCLCSEKALRMMKCLSYSHQLLAKQRTSQLSQASKWNMISHFAGLLVGGRNLSLTGAWWMFSVNTNATPCSLSYSLPQSLYFTVVVFVFVWTTPFCCHVSSHFCSFLAHSYRLL